MFSDILIDFNQRPAYVIDKSLDLCLNILRCGYGGIGRRARLRIWCHRRGGSSPFSRTKTDRD